MPHTAVPVKVNVWVDEGVAPLVDALSRWESIVALDSCEAGPDALAYVQFTAEPVDQLLVVTKRLADYLNDMEDCPAVLSVEWSFGGEIPLGKIACDRREVGRLSDLLATAHRKASACDKGRTGTRSSRARPSHPSTLR